MNTRTLFRGNSQRENVHAYADDARRIAGKLKCTQPISREAMCALFRELHNAYDDADPLRSVLAKMQSRYNVAQGGYICPDTRINVTALLALTWEHVKALEAQSDFAEILLEIGNTCVQGDSFRLLFYFDAIQD